MTNQSTIDKLIEMRLTSMSDAFITQMEDPKMKDLSFEDRFVSWSMSSTTTERTTALNASSRGPVSTSLKRMWPGSTIHQEGSSTVN